MQVQEGSYQHRLTPAQRFSNDSLIFEFCRQGNVGAIRILLQKGLASIDDINEFDETPLQVGHSSFAGTDFLTVCRLLQVAAKPRFAVFFLKAVLTGKLKTSSDGEIPRPKLAVTTDHFYDHMTPLMRACLPGDIVNLECQSVLRQTKSHMTPTLHELLKSKDLDDVDENGTALSSIVSMKGAALDDMNNVEIEVLYKWILDDVLPVTSYHVLGDVWWTCCFTNFLQGNRKTPIVATILGSCSIQAVRLAFIRFIEIMKWDSTAG